MSGQNLQRDEAHLRGQIVRTQSYQVHLDLTPSDTVFRSETKVEFTAKVGSSTFIDLIAPHVHSIVLNGQTLDVDQHFQDSRIHLPGLQAENTLEVIADCAYMNTGEGLHRFVDPVDQEVYLYSQFEVADSRRVFAVFEQPNLKAEFTFTVTAPAHWQVISNGTPSSTHAPGAGSPPKSVKTELATSGNKNGIHDRGIAKWNFETTPRIPSYITAIIAGPYASVTDSLVSSDGRTIPLGLFARASIFKHLDVENVFTITKQGFKFFEAKLGVPYPFDKYDQLFVPEFNAGAMENAGAVTFLEDYVFRGQASKASFERRAITILHELAHMWFGNLVTMSWWDDLWLNESFAEYMATLAAAEATEWKDAWVSFSALEKNWAYRQDQLPSTHPIVADMVDLAAVELNFDGITYAKGASVLTQLVTYVGQDNFFTGVREYFEQHAWGNTTLDDFLGALERASGRDLGPWAKQWLQTSQVNTLHAEITPAASAEGETELSAGATMPNTLVADTGTPLIGSLTVHQSAVEDHPTLRAHRIAISTYRTGADQPRLLHTWMVDVSGPKTVIGEAAGTEMPDLVILNDFDHGYVKVHYDEESYSVITEHLSAFENPLTRSVLWSSAWDDTRSAQLPASKFVDLVLRHIDSESHPGLLANLLRQLTATLDNYVAPAHRTKITHRAAEKMLQLAHGTRGDQQLQCVKTFANLATAAHIGLLSSWFMGQDLPAGFELDTELRWHLLHNLARLGAVGESEINEFLAGDDTASGQLHAAYARASLPSVETKSEVWGQLVGQTQLANALQGELIAGFNNVDDPHLLLDFGPQYFEKIQDLWLSRTPEMAQDLAHGLYPLGLVAHQDVVGATGRLLGELDDDAAAGGAQSKRLAGLRRVLLEELDGARRAVAAQELDSKHAG